MGLKIGPKGRRTRNLAWKDLGRVEKKISALYRTIFPCFGKIVNLDDDISRYIYISRRTGKGRRLWAIEGDEDEDNEAEVDIM